MNSYDNASIIILTMMARDLIIGQSTKLCATTSLSAFDRDVPFKHLFGDQKKRFFICDSFGSLQKSNEVTWAKKALQIEVCM